MFREFANIKKLMLLGLAVASTKVMLLLFAYFFNSETYNQFNQIYYTASIVILFGSLGFNIAVTRINVNLNLLTFAVVLTTLAAYLCLHILSAPYNSSLEIISILIYCSFISISGISAFHILFSGRYRDYVFVTILYSILHLLIIPSILFFKLSLFILLPCVSILWFMLSFPKFIKHSNSNPSALKEFFKIGISAFVINSAVSLALAADKYFVNHFFSIDIANAYTFAWSLTAPMFYIGALIEQYLFSETNKSRANILKHGFLMNISLVALYTIAAIILINLLPGIIPSSVDYQTVVRIFSFMLIGYSIYVAIHFPVNAFLFKSLGVGKQKTISVFFTIIIGLYIVVYAMLLQGVFVINYVSILLITWSYIFLLLITKVIIMFKGKESETTSDNLMEINNIEI